MGSRQSLASKDWNSMFTAVSVHPPPQWLVAPWPIMFDCLTLTCSLNVLELKSLEEPMYLAGQFFNQPMACLGLLKYIIANTGWWADTRAGCHTCL